MLQNNLLLTQLKNKLNSKIPRAEGIVKSTGKNFGFLEISDENKSYFIPPPYMKKVMHGDRIIAMIHTDKERENAEPESLIEPFLTRFVGKIIKKDNCLLITPDHPMLRNTILCSTKHDVSYNFQHGDWVVAKMLHHPLEGNHGFHAELIEFITTADDNKAPWWVTLSRYNLERQAPEIECSEMLDEKLDRVDLTSLHFVTIDGPNTEDIDDALHVKETSDGNFLLTVAIADPTSYIAEGSEIDTIASKRAFTNYLPGFNIPMLPRILSEDLCSLQPHKRRPALVCQVTVMQDGKLQDDVQFFSAWIESKSKLLYNDISDWLEHCGTWYPKNNYIAEQIILLHKICVLRIQWRKINALVFKEKPEYRFVLDNKGNVLNVTIEHRRIANRIIEEAMILANICAANVLQKTLGFGIYNTHSGFDTTHIESLIEILSNYGIKINPKYIKTLDGFVHLNRQIDAQKIKYLEGRIRRFQSIAEISIQPGPHFGLGLSAYATWTSPIRKFGDMINHRLLKSVVRGDITTVTRPHDRVIVAIRERKRLNRMAERDINDWLYSIFLSESIGSKRNFSAEIIDIFRGGMRVRLEDNGAVAFVPSSFIHTERHELICLHEEGILQIKGKTVYSVTDIINVIIVEIRNQARLIIAQPI